MAVRVRWFILPPPPPVPEERTVVVKFGSRKGVKRMTIQQYRKAMQRERAESRKGYEDE
jgi:hypothetical protein